MQRITHLQTARLRHIAQTWRGSQTDLVWSMCGSEFAVSRVHNRLWQCHQDGKLIGASQNPDGAIGHAMRVYVNHPSNKHCTYCGNPILAGQPSVPDEYGDRGERMHIGCAVEQQEGDELNRELED